MRAGLLRHRVTIQKPDPARGRDSAGQKLSAWIDVATVNASIRPLTAREVFIARAQQASTTHVVSMRYGPASSSILNSWRLKYNLRYFVMDGPPINVGELSRDIELSCIEGLRDE